MASQKRKVRRVDTRIGHEKGDLVCYCATLAGPDGPTYRRLHHALRATHRYPAVPSLSGDICRSCAVYRRPRGARLVPRESRSPFADDWLDAVTNTHAAQPRRRHHFPCTSDHSDTCRSCRRFPEMHRIGFRPVGHPSIRPSHHTADLWRAAHRDRRSHRPHTGFDLTRRRHRWCRFGERRAGTFRLVRRTGHRRRRRLVFAAPRKPGDRERAAQVGQGDDDTSARSSPGAQASG